MPPTCSSTFLPFSFASHIFSPVPVGTASAAPPEIDMRRRKSGFFTVVGAEPRDSALASCCQAPLLNAPPTSTSIVSPARDVRLVQPFSKRTRTIPESISRLSKTSITSPTASEPRAAESSSAVSRIVAFFTALYSPRSPVSSPESSALSPVSTAAVADVDSSTPA